MNYKSLLVIAFVSLKMFTWMRVVVGGRWRRFFIRWHSRKLIEAWTTKKWSRFVLKIARDYAENAPKAAFVIYRFRNEQHVFYAPILYWCASDAECDCDPLFLARVEVPKMLCIMSISQICWCYWELDSRADAKIIEKKTWIAAVNCLKSLTDRASPYQLSVSISCINRCQLFEFSRQKRYWGIGNFLIAALECLKM